MARGRHQIQVLNLLFSRPHLFKTPIPSTKLSLPEQHNLITHRHCYLEGYCDRLATRTQHRSLSAPAGVLWPAALCAPFVCISALCLQQRQFLPFFPLFAFTFFPPLQALFPDAILEQRLVQCLGGSPRGNFMTSSSSGFFV